MVKDVEIEDYEERKISMWQCKECGKKFNIEPVYCDFCGATDDFLEPVDHEEIEDFYKHVEDSFNASVSNAKSFHDYDSLVKDFMADEYKPISTRVKEPFEDEIRLKAEKEARDKILNSQDHEYYESIKSVVGTESIEKDDYYKSLEDMFKEPIHSGDQTTFNGIFKKDDTIENTFLRPKKKVKRSGVSMEAVKNPEKKKMKMPMPAISSFKSNESKREPTVLGAKAKDNRKLIKIVGILGALFIAMIVLMFTLVNIIVDSGDNSGKLPSEKVLLEFFADVKAIDEQTFLSNPSMVSFYGYAGTIEEKENMLKNLYAMVTAEDLTISGAEDIVQKGINRVQVDFDVTGNKVSVDTLDQLLFRTNDNKTYQLDFADFVIQYTIANSNKENEQPN